MIINSSYFSMKYLFLSAISASAFICSVNPAFAHNSPRQQFHKPLPDGTTIEHVHKIVGPSAMPQEDGPEADDVNINFCSGNHTTCLIP